MRSEATRSRAASCFETRTSGAPEHEVGSIRGFRRVNRREPRYRLLIIVVPASMASLAEMKPHALSEVHGHAAARVIVVVPGSMMASMAEMKPHVRSEVHGCAAVPVV